MTYSTLCQLLKNAGIDSPEWDAAQLLQHFFQADILTLRTSPDTDYSSPDFDFAVQKRLAREPLQYILGDWSFFRQTYEVSPDCLIPRSDTEILVEKAIQLLPQGAYFADLCTGSGCIAVSVLAERPDTNAIAVDKFEGTLSLATRNANRNGVSNRFTALCADVLADDFFPSDVPLDAILSNPPYIQSDIISTLSPEVQAEPRVALDGGKDGLLFYRSILQHAERWLKPHGMVLLEIGYDQGEAIRSLATTHGFANCQIFQDLNALDRVVLLSKSF